MVREIFFTNCTMCRKETPSSYFLPTKNMCYPGHIVPVCNDCVKDLMGELDSEGLWERIDKICQYLDIPFIPEKIMPLLEQNQKDGFLTYAKLFQQEQYQDITWGEYQEYYRQLKEESRLQSIVPGANAARIEELKGKWGYNYDEEELEYLEKLYQGLLNTQNVNGFLQTDQAIKLCKVSLQIDSRIREGTDFDKLLGSYEKLVKVADFTPKNVKNANDFDSVGEIFAYLEKTGWENKFYDGVTRDIVDGTMSNIQKYCRRLYVGESGMGDEIQRRIESLKISQTLEDEDYGLDEDYSETNKFDFESVDEEFQEDI